MRWGAFWWAALLAAPWAFGEQLTLQRALELASRGPMVRAAELAAEEAEARVGEAKAWRMPQVELEAQARGLRKDPGFLVPRGAFGNPIPLALVTGEREVQTGRFTVSQLLWDWQRTSLAVAAARAQAQAAGNQGEAVRQKVLRAAAEAFAQAWRAQGELAASQQAREAAGETLRVVQAMVAQGILPKSDQLVAEYALQRREAELAGARAAVSSALAVLRELTGAEVEGVVLEPQVFAAADRLDGTDVSRRRELQALRWQREALQSAARAVGREQWPVLAVVGGVDYVRDHFYLHQTNSFAALVLKANLFDGSRAVSQRKALELGAEEVSQTLLATERAAERELAVASAKELAAKEALAAAEKALVAAEEEVRLETLRHAEGLATTRDLLAAQEHLAQARAAVAGAQAAWLSALAEKTAASGHDFLRVFGGER